MNKIAIGIKDIENMIFESVNSILNEENPPIQNTNGNPVTNPNPASNTNPSTEPTKTNPKVATDNNPQNNQSDGTNQQNNDKNLGKLNWQQRFMKWGNTLDHAGDVAQKLANHDPAADVERLLNGGNPASNNPYTLNAQQVQQCKQWITNNYGNQPNYQKLLFNDPKDQNSPYGSLATTNKQFANMVYKYAKEQYTRLSMGYK